MPRPATDLHVIATTTAGCSSYCMDASVLQVAAPQPCDSAAFQPGGPEALRDYCSSCSGVEMQRLQEHFVPASPSLDVDAVLLLQQVFQLSEHLEMAEPEYSTDEEERLQSKPAVKWAPVLAKEGGSVQHSPQRSRQRPVKPCLRERSKEFVYPYAADVMDLDRQAPHQIAPRRSRILKQAGQKRLRLSIYC